MAADTELVSRIAPQRQNTKAFSCKDAREVRCRPDRRLALILAQNAPTNKQPMAMRAVIVQQISSKLLQVPGCPVLLLRQPRDRNEARNEPKEKSRGSVWRSCSPVLLSKTRRLMSFPP